MKLDPEKVGYQAALLQRAYMDNRIEGLMVFLLAARSISEGIIADLPPPLDEEENFIPHAIQKLTDEIISHLGIEE